MRQNKHMTIEENITIYDTPFAQMSDVRSQLELQPSDYILIDYVQLMKAENKELSGEDEVSFIVYGLKNLARELRIPVIALNQISRNGDFRIRFTDLADINVTILSRTPFNSHQLIYESHVKNKICIMQSLL